MIDSSSAPAGATMQAGGAGGRQEIGWAGGAGHLQIRDVAAAVDVAGQAGVVRVLVDRAVREEAVGARLVAVDELPHVPLAVVVQQNRKVSDVCHIFDPVPQLLRNVRFNGGAPLEDDKVIAAIESGEASLGQSGRIVIRKSGTEPVIRVMAESDDDKLVTGVVDDIVTTIEQAAG